MRVLTLIITFNDAAVIQQALEGLRRQTRPSDAIVIVDNASTDGTLDKDFSKTVMIFRNSKNLGPSGAVRIGFAFAFENGFDWTWVLDADSVPEPEPTRSKSCSPSSIICRPRSKSEFVFWPVGPLPKQAESNSNP